MDHYCSDYYFYYFFKQRKQDFSRHESQNRCPITLHRQSDRFLQFNLKSDGTDCIPYCQTLSLDETSGISSSIFPMRVSWSSTCSVSFQIEDVYLKKNNITFGSEFQDRGDGSYECMHFETKQATGFTTPEAVKREMLCQFNWSQISTNITELKVLNYGAFTHTPMVTLRFEAQYRD